MSKVYNDNFIKIQNRLRKIPVPSDAAGKNVPPQFPAFWAKLGDEDPGNAGFYKWTMVAFDGTAWAELSPTIDSGDAYSANEINGTSELKSGTRVRLKFAAYDDDGDPVFLFTSRPQPVQVAMLRITSSADQGGVYNANILSAPGTDIPAGSDLAASDIGIAGAPVLALNVKEEGASTHDLTDSGNTDLDCIGVYLRTNDDGTKVYAIDKIQLDCDDTESASDGGV